MDYAALGEKIRIQRKNMHLTQEQLAEKLNLSASFLGHIERGTRVASLETIIALCKALQVSPAFLFEKELEDVPVYIPHPVSNEVRETAIAILEYAYQLIQKTEPEEP